MWSSGNDTNDDGESILLLLPVGSGGIKRRNKNKGYAKNDPSSSHIGGHPCYHENDTLLSRITRNGAQYHTNPKCAICDKVMNLLLQLNAPLDAVNRTLYVFGCNDASCFSVKNAAAGEDGISSCRFQSCIGSDTKGGPLLCVRSQQQWKTETSNAITTNNVPAKESQGNKLLENNDWTMGDCSDDDWGDDGDDDWGSSGTTGTKENANEISMDDLENMLTKCEVHSAKLGGSVPSKKLPTTTNSPSGAPGISSNKLDNASAKSDFPPSFEHNDLEMMDEPSTGRGNGDSDDEDDAECSNIEASRVDQMLSRYLDIEEDTDILSALKGGGKGSDGGSGNHEKEAGGGGERYERLPPEERAFHSFSTRLKRVPRQVARYAYRGVPLWSIPLPPSSNSARRNPKKQHNKSKKKPVGAHSPLPVVPRCECGAERVFEFQILPSLLHVLDVDVHATTAVSPKNSDDVMDLISSGGMNWGSIAVYSCSESCEQSREEFIIVQEAVCDAPISRGKKGETKDDSDDNDDCMDDT